MQDLYDTINADPVLQWVFVMVCSYVGAAIVKLIAAECRDELTKAFATAIAAKQKAEN